MLLSGGPEPDRAEDARAGIPAGIGLVGVAGDDQQLVLPFLQGAVQLRVEIGVAVGPGGDLLSVEPDLGVVIHALEFQDQLLPGQVLRQGKELAIFVVAALEPADVALAQAGADPGLGAHGVVRQGDGDGLAARLQRPTGPAAVEIISFHLPYPFAFRSGSRFPLLFLCFILHKSPDPARENPLARARLFCQYREYIGERSGGSWTDLVLSRLYYGDNIISLKVKRKRICAH